MRLLHSNPHTESIGHDGEQYERDEHGAFDLPHELAEKLLEGFSHLWSVAPEPVPTEPAEPVKPKRGSKAKTEQAEDETDPEQVEKPQTPAEPVTETPQEATGDGDAPPARASSTGRASSRKASA